MMKELKMSELMQVGGGIGFRKPSDEHNPYPKNKQGLGWKWGDDWSDDSYFEEGRKKA